MFEAPHYCEGRPPPPDPRLLHAADSVCKVLHLDPLQLFPVPGGCGGMVSRRDLVAADCALVLLMMQSLACEGIAVRTHE